MCCAQGVEVIRGVRKLSNPTNQSISDSKLSRNSIKNSAYFTWQKTLYREIELSSSHNATLLQKHQLIGKTQNLFSLIFNLISEGKLTIYEYLDGTEQLDREHELSFTDLVRRFSVDAESQAIKAYYIKEINYFNQAQSRMGKEVIALCPILYDQGEHGELRKPLFWLKFEDLSPFLSEDLVSLSKKNEAIRGTLLDFFILGMYQGKIIHTGSLDSELPPSTETSEKIEQKIQSITSNLSLPDSIINARKNKINRKAKKGTKIPLDSMSPTTTKRSARNLS